MTRDEALKLAAQAIGRAGSNDDPARRAKAICDTAEWLLGRDETVENAPAPAAPASAAAYRDNSGDIWTEDSPGSGTFSWTHNRDGRRRTNRDGVFASRSVAWLAERYNRLQPVPHPEGCSPAAANTIRVFRDADGDEWRETAPGSGQFDMYYDGSDSHRAVGSDFRLGQTLEQTHAWIERHNPSEGPLTELDPRPYAG